MELPQGDPGWDANGAPARRATAGIAIVEKRCDWQDCGRVFAPGRPNQRFCGKACKDAWYEAHRPRILNPAAGAPRAGTIKAAVLGVLHDRLWHTAHDLAAKVKADKHSVVTRISELRAQGFPIEADLPCGNARRPHRFRLVQL